MKNPVLLGVNVPSPVNVWIEYPPEDVIVPPVAA
jgi:hypothetical protein